MFQTKVWRLRGRGRLGDHRVTAHRRYRNTAFSTPVVAFGSRSSFWVAEKQVEGRTYESMMLPSGAERRNFVHKDCMRRDPGWQISAAVENFSKVHNVPLVMS